MIFATGGRAAPALPRLPALGVDLDGSWDGLLLINGGAMPITFSIASVDGKSTVAIDILEQNAQDIPVTGATRQGDRLRLDAAAIDGAFEGTVAPGANAIQGAWTQAGKRIPLNLKRRTE